MLTQPTASGATVLPSYVAPKTSSHFSRQNGQENSPIDYEKSFSPLPIIVSLCSSGMNSKMPKMETNGQDVMGLKIGLLTRMAKWKSG